jgi:hypothetical protein
MTREETLLSSAKYALEVLNMLWDDGRVKEVLKARLDLETAIQMYEVENVVKSIPTKGIYSDTFVDDRNFIHDLIENR